MARTDWPERDHTNSVKMKCDKCGTVYVVAGMAALKGNVGCKKPSCKGNPLHRA